MKTRVITIKIPKEKSGMWELGFNRGPVRKRVNVTTVYNTVRRHLLGLKPCSEIKEKTTIIVKGYIDSHLEILNESCDSRNPNYLLFCLACFLENYLEEEFLNLQINAYKELGQNP